MEVRWSASLIALVAILAIASVPGTGDDVSRLTIRDAEGGALLASVPLPADGAVALRYRNSLYGSLAEERFTITDDGELQLVQLASDELAVLEEYYAIATPAWRAADDDRRAWLAEPALAMTTEQLRIAATDLGERTLIVEGEEPLPLWELQGADPTVVLGVEDRTLIGY
ncbi:MAG: hypothetical protein GEU79_08385 [Acidimicrobiia bacterium]|nr:hypothetical protein [Acidimicrobiia bacterium]